MFSTTLVVSFCLNLERAECFLCEGEDDLRKEMTMKHNDRDNACAMALGDSKLLAVWDASGAIAQKLKYHPTCRIDLYSRLRTYIECLRTKERRIDYPIVFSNQVIYFNETNEREE